MRCCSCQVRILSWVFLTTLFPDDFISSQSKTTLVSIRMWTNQIATQLAVHSSQLKTNDDETAKRKHKNRKRLGINSNNKKSCIKNEHTLNYNIRNWDRSNVTCSKIYSTVHSLTRTVIMKLLNVDFKIILFYRKYCKILSMFRWNPTKHTFNEYNSSVW